MEESAHLPLDAHGTTDATQSHAQPHEQRPCHMWQESSSVDSLTMQAMRPMQLSAKPQSLCIADGVSEQTPWSTTNAQGLREPSALLYARPGHQRPHTVHGAGSYHAAVDQCSDVFVPGLAECDLQHIPTLLHCAHSDPPCTHDVIQTVNSQSSMFPPHGYQGLYDPKHRASVQPGGGLTGRCRDFEYLDVPAVPSVSVVHPTHRIWSPNVLAAASEDPLMQPLPPLDRTTSLSPTKRLSLSLSAEGHSDSHSPKNAMQPFDTPADRRLPLDDPLQQTVDAGQHHHLVENVVSSSHRAPQALCNFDASLHAPHTFAHQPSTLTQYEPQTAGRAVSCAEEQQARRSDFPRFNDQKPSDKGIHPTYLSFSRSGIDATRRGNMNMSLLSRSAPPDLGATHVFASSEAIDHPPSGYDAVSGHSSPFGLPTRYHVDTRPVQSTREHSLRILHSSLCNVGSRPEMASVSKRAHTGMAVHKQQPSDVAPSRGQHRSSHFQPVMIPSDADWPPSEAFAAHMQPFSQATVAPAPYSSSHSIQRWHSPDKDASRRIKGLSDDSSCPPNWCSTQPVQFHAHFPSDTAQVGFASGRQQFPASSDAGPRNRPSMLHYQSGEAEVFAGIGTVGAPGRMKADATLHDSQDPNRHPEHTPTESAKAAHECTVRGGRALQYHACVTQHGPMSSPRPVHASQPSFSDAQRNVPSSSLDGRSKRSAKTLSEMVAAADAVGAPAVPLYGPTSSCTDTSLHSSSKRTRTSTATALLADSSVTDGPTASIHTGHTTGLTGTLAQIHVSEPGGSTHGGRNRRARIGLDPKEEHTLEDWVALIAREESAGDSTAESKLRDEFFLWETRSKSAPNGKWRGANSRKWGKVGIEMRLTGSVPRTQGPQTHLGKMVCKFVDVVELKDCRVGRELGLTQDVVAQKGCASLAATDVAQITDSVFTPLIGTGTGQALAAPSSHPRFPDTSNDPHSLAVASNVSQPSVKNEVYVWRLAEIVDKQGGGGVKTVLKEKVWLGTYHTPINAAVHHDFYKVVLAVEGCIYTSVDVPSCSAPTGKKKSQKLKLNFPLSDLPELMYKAVRFTQLWNKYKQDAERYVFRTYDPETVRNLVQQLIDIHCGELRKHVANNEAEAAAGMVERRSTRTRTTVSQRECEDSHELSPLS